MLHIGGHVMLTRLSRCSSIQCCWRVTSRRRRLISPFRYKTRDFSSTTIGLLAEAVASASASSFSRVSCLHSRSAMRSSTIITVSTVPNYFLVAGRVENLPAVAENLESGSAAAVIDMNHAAILTYLRMLTPCKAAHSSKFHTCPIQITPHQSATS